MPKKENGHLLLNVCQKFGKGKQKEKSRAGEVKVIIRDLQLVSEQKAIKDEKGREKERDYSLEHVRRF